MEGKDIGSPPKIEQVSEIGTLFDNIVDSFKKSIQTLDNYSKNTITPIHIGQTYYESCREKLNQFLNTFEFYNRKGLISFLENDDNPTFQRNEIKRIMTEIKEDIEKIEVHLNNKELKKPYIDLLLIEITEWVDKLNLELKKIKLNLK